MKKILLYGILLGLLIPFLKLMEYRFVVRDHAMELYGGLVALLFTVLGVWLGFKLTRTREVLVVKEIRIPYTGDFIVDELKLKELGISKREYEILQLIAEGLSNKEISERLFVSPNTVKTHSGRLFEKLDASRRTQAVQKAKSLGLIA